jgi:hypothetical protein
MAWNGCTSGAGLGTTNGMFPVAITGGAMYTDVLPGDENIVDNCNDQFDSKKNKVFSKETLVPYCSIIISTRALTMTWICYLETLLDMCSAIQGEAILGR